MCSARAAVFCLAGMFAATSGREPALVFSTLVGVADCDGIAAWQGDAYLACHSPGSRLPVSVQGEGGPPDVMSGYVLRLNLKTGKLVYATRVGGPEFSALFRIKVDEKGFAYAAGLTRSREFATTADAVQRRFGGGESDAMLVKLAPTGEVVYATYLGGSGADQGNGLHLDGQGGVFVGGTTWSNDFPGQRAHGTKGAGDAFVSHFQPGDPGSLRSVVFGGRQEEKLTGLALDGRGGIFAVGYTKSRDFPLAAPLQSALGGISDAFLTRLKLPELAISFSTYLGARATIPAGAWPWTGQGIR